MPTHVSRPGRPDAVASTGSIHWSAVTGLCRLRAGGDPETYLIPSRDFMALIDEGLPDERQCWHSDPGDILSDRWLGRTTINGELLARCDPDEWLLVEAWDES